MFVSGAFLPSGWWWLSQYHLCRCLPTVRRYSTKIQEVIFLIIRQQECMTDLVIYVARTAPSFKLCGSSSCVQTTQLFLEGISKYKINVTLTLNANFFHYCKLHFEPYLLKIGNSFLNLLSSSVSRSWRPLFTQPLARHTTGQTLAFSSPSPSLTMECSWYAHRYLARPTSLS